MGRYTCAPLIIFKPGRIIGLDHMFIHNVCNYFDFLSGLEVRYCFQIGGVITELHAKSTPVLRAARGK